MSPAVFTPTSCCRTSRFFATGQIANDRQEHPTVVQTVTVEVSTEQAQKLILAEKVGTLSLVLKQVGGSRGRPAHNLGRSWRS
jgi:Flp pilus assembly protein CpaB